MNRYFPRVLLARHRRLMTRKEWHESSPPVPNKALEVSDSSEDEGNVKKALVVSDTSEDEAIAAPSRIAQVKNALSATELSLPEEPADSSLGPFEDPYQRYEGRLSMAASNILMLTNQEKSWRALVPALEEWHGLVTEADVVKLMVNIKDHKLATHIFRWAARQDNYQHTVFTYNAYLNVLVKAGKTMKVRKAFNEMQELGCLPNIYTYGIVLRGSCDAGRVDQAIDFVKNMESKMLTPTSFICNMLIGCLCRHGRIDEAFKYFSDLREESPPDLITYNSLMHGLCKTDQLDRALAVFSRMELDNVKPTLLTYNSLLYGYCRVGRVEDALDLLKEMSDGKKGPDIVPDLYSYNTLIFGLCKVNRLQTARHLLKRIIKQGLVPNVVTYNSLLHGLCLAGKVDEANEIFQHMVSRNCEPTVMTYTTMINGNCKAKDIGKAREYFLDMLKRKVEPNVYTYTSLIGGLCDANELDDAVEMLNQMAAHGKDPNVVTYTRVIGSLCRGGKGERAAKLFRESMGKHSQCKPDLSAFNTIIFGLCKNNLFAQAFEFFQQMVEMRFVADPALYKTLFQGLELIDDSAKAGIVFEEARKQGIQVQPLPMLRQRPAMDSKSTRRRFEQSAWLRVKMP